MPGQRSVKLESALVKEIPQYTFRESVIAYNVQFTVNRGKL